MDGLSEQQMRLLRLVAAGTTSSKALALETGLQPRSIDTYLQAASKALGCKTRILAARRFAELEREKSQSSSQLRSTRVAALLIRAIVVAAKAARSFAFGLPMGGREHDFGWRRVAPEILRASVIGMAWLFALMLFVVGFQKTFS